MFGYRNASNNLTKIILNSDFVAVLSSWLTGFVVGYLQKFSATCVFVNRFTFCRSRNSDSSKGDDNENKDDKENTTLPLEVRMQEYRQMLIERQVT